MTEHEHDHMPPIQQFQARTLSPGKIVILVGTHMHVLTWDEALQLALSMTDALQLEVTR